MLAALSNEPLAGAVVAAAAFSGLRRSELRRLRWQDLRENQLFVTRTVWGTKERNKTKTTDSKAPVPVIPLLGKYLEDHRDGFPGTGYIFAGPKLVLNSMRKAKNGSPLMTDVGTTRKARKAKKSL